MSIHRTNGLISLHFDPATLTGNIDVAAGGGSWSLDLSAARGVRCGPAEPSRYVFPWECHCPAMEKLRPLRPADVITSRETERGLELEFGADGARFRVTLEIEAGAPELVFALTPVNAGAADLVAAELPGPITPAGGKPAVVLAGAMDQGRLYTGKPGNLGFEGAERPEEMIFPESRMRWRWWGVLGESAGCCAIIEDNADAELAVRRAGPGNITGSVRWLPAMGLLTYERRVRYCFEAAATPTSLTKRFRRWAKDSGLFKTLLEKAEGRPRLKGMIGATGVFAGYQASDLDYEGTCRRLREMGHERLYLFPIYHVRNPFEPQGDDARIGPREQLDLRERIPQLRELGALVGTWCYLEGVDVAHRPDMERIAQLNADGSRPLNWRRNEWLWYQACRRRLLATLRDHRDELEKFDAVHFDTTASNALMECYDPHHPHDRRGDRALRIEEFDYAASLGLLVASEGCKDWAVPHLDVASNKRPAVWGEDAPYWSVPLQQLAFHDAIISTWWEIDGYDCPEFHGGRVAEQALTDTLYGDPPLIFPVGGQKTGGSGTGLGITYFEHTLDNPLCREAAGRAVEVARLHGRVGTEEMTEHEFLTEDGAVQATAFAGGTRVVANFSPEPYSLPGGVTVPPGGHAID